ncbi:5-formyltetrahydrofolate cyclo-ligase [Thioclava sp. JE_KL1]|uniref:5-formyltetrahydrofolate cyclo-ligase n=1 Tax=Thioclava sp. JE_KL1 TaxID=2651187 RepID=UPI00128BC5D7|nr:5-formyltetrahydrofolate cyclo-ligase [Thioclava sp. JE_KL1]
MADLHKAGETVALPLASRNPHGARRLEHSRPASDAPVVAPDIAWASLVGWTAEVYCLGYGGCYFDRTLAALKSKPFVVGIAFDAAKLTSIYPYPLDITLDLIVTENGIQAVRDLA